MKIIGFSGPPGSGKDSIADAIVSQLNNSTPALAHKMSLAAPMRGVGMTLLGYDPRNHADYTRLKGEPQPLLVRKYCSRTMDNLRQFMIAFSEDFIKPRYGDDFWGRLLYGEALALGLEDAVILVPDFGFYREVKFFEDTVGWQNLITVRLSRAGCDFSVDSRNYVESSQTYWLDNDETIELAARRVIDAATHGYRWSL